MILEKLKEAIEIEFPNCKIELFYIDENMEKYQNKLETEYWMMLSIMRDLCKLGDIELYIRLHGYKNWLVIRIGIINFLPVLDIEKMKRKWQQYNDRLLISFSKTDYSIFIKLCC